MSNRNKINTVYIHLLKYGWEVYKQKTSPYDGAITLYLRYPYNHKNEFSLTLYRPRD